MLGHAQFVFSGQTNGPRGLHSPPWGQQSGRLRPSVRSATCAKMVGMTRRTGDEAANDLRTLKVYHTSLSVCV